MARADGGNRDAGGDAWFAGLVVRRLLGGIRVLGEEAGQLFHATAQLVEGRQAEPAGLLTGPNHSICSTSSQGEGFGGGSQCALAATFRG